MMIMWGMMTPWVFECPIRPLTKTYKPLRGYVNSRNYFKFTECML